MSKISILFVLLLLAVWSADAAEPDRPHEGLTEADFERARDECDAYVRENFNPHHAFDSPVRRTTRAEVNRNRRRAAEQMFERCMNERGFQRGGADSG